MADTRPARVASLRRAIKAQHADALLVTSLPNIRYLTGFSGSAAMLVVTMSDIVMLTDFRYQEQVVHEVASAARVVIEAQSLWTRLWSLLPELGVERVAFETAHLPHRDFTRLMESGSRWQWRATSDLVEALRERKDPGELECIRTAAGMATGALERTLPHCRPGMTELEIAGVLEHALRDAGSEGYPFETIVAAGPRSALPHARASANVARDGD